MRCAFFLFSYVFLLVPLTVQAGQISSVNGQAQWVSTECLVPEIPAALSGNPEAAANDLNTTVGAHNDYAARAQAYMDCLSAESARDAEAMSKMIVDEAAKKIAEMTQKVNESAQGIKAKQGE